MLQPLRRSLVPRPKTISQTISTTQIMPDKLPTIHDYAVEVVVQRLERMLSHADDAREGTNTRAVYQMRVWSRRSRAALDVFAEAFPGTRYRSLTREIKAVTAALGAARDLDVMIETLQRRAAALPLEQRPGVEQFISRLRRQRDAAQKTVARAVVKLERQDTKTQFLEIAQRRQKRHESAASSGAVTLEELEVREAALVAAAKQAEVETRELLLGSTEETISGSTRNTKTEDTKHEKNGAASDTPGEAGQS